MGGELSGTVWDRAAPDFDRVGPRFFSHDGRRLVDLAHIPKGARVLDVATGRGAVLLPAAERVGLWGSVVGVDLSTGMVRETTTQIRHAGPRQVTLGQMDAGRLAFRDRVFDRVLSGNGIVFFPHAVDEFYRVLRPGGCIGLIIVAIECFAWLLEVFRAHASPEDPRTDEEEDGSQADPLRIDSFEGMRSLLADAGFEDADVALEEKIFVYASEEEWWSTLWTWGFRSTLERMAPPALESLRADLDQRLEAFKQPDGLHVPFHSLFAFGRKSR